MRAVKLTSLRSHGPPSDLIEPGARGRGPVARSAVGAWGGVWAEIAVAVGLGVAQAVAAGALVVVALAAPAKREGFRGVVNDTTSKGSARRLELFREEFGWLPTAGW